MNFTSLILTQSPCITLFLVLGQNQVSEILQYRMATFETQIPSLVQAPWLVLHCFCEMYVMQGLIGDKSRPKILRSKSDKWITEIHSTLISTKNWWSPIMMKSIMIMNNLFKAIRKGFLTFLGGQKKIIQSFSRNWGY